MSRLRKRHFVLQRRREEIDFPVLVGQIVMRNSRHVPAMEASVCVVWQVAGVAHVQALEVAEHSSREYPEGKARFGPNDNNASDSWAEQLLTVDVYQLTILEDD